MSECVEPYKECMAARTARVREVLTENPYDSEPQLAEKAGVDRSTITREKKRLLQIASGEADCNSKLTLAEEESWESQPEIQAVTVAIYALNPAQREYVWKHLIPDLKTFLRSV